MWRMDFLIPKGKQVESAKQETHPYSPGSWPPLKGEVKII
jgi:hypothetical protein